MMVLQYLETTARNSFISWLESAHVMLVLQACHPEAMLCLYQPEKHLSVTQCDTYEISGISGEFGRYGVL